jgi:GH24 family phage-related lysozyme (muramidase)
MDRPRVRRSLIAEECPNREWTNERYPDPGGGFNMGVGHHMSVNVTADGFREALPEEDYEDDDPTLLPSDTQSITNAGVSHILNDDIDVAISDVIYWLGSPSVFEGLSNVRQDVLVQMAFQLGRSHLVGFTQTRLEILEGDWEDAAAEMRDSDWYRENSPDRAARMSDAMEDNNPANFLQAADPYEGG